MKNTMCLPAAPASIVPLNNGWCPSENGRFLRLSPFLPSLLSKLGPPSPGIHSKLRGKPHSKGSDMKGTDSQVSLGRKSKKLLWMPRLEWRERWENWVGDYKDRPRDTVFRNQDHQSLHASAAAPVQGSSYSLVKGSVQGL